MRLRLRVLRAYAFPMHCCLYLIFHASLFFPSNTISPPQLGYIYEASLRFFLDITLKCTHLRLNSSSGSAYFGVAPTARICVLLSERLSFFLVGWTGTEPFITINFVWSCTRMSWCLGFFLRGKPFFSPAPLSSPLDFHRRAVLDRVSPTAQLENFPSSCPRGGCQVERLQRPYL